MIMVRLLLCVRVTSTRACSTGTQVFIANPAGTVSASRFSIAGSLMTSKSARLKSSCSINCSIPASPAGVGLTTISDHWP
jgi:hypothetical protein